MRLVLACGLGLVLLTGCGRKTAPELHGYVEGEYARIAAPFAGQLVTLAVGRGATVRVGDALFTLEQENEKAARQEAERRLRSAEAKLSDQQKGKRPDEVAMVEAQLAQARATAHQSQTQWLRDAQLVAQKFISPERLDQSRAARDRDLARVSELQAQLRVARQGARPDEIAAARAEMQAAQAALTQAQWRLDQKTVAAPVAGLVDDTLFTPGEWVPAGTPVVSVLPPTNLKIRFFVPEPLLARLKLGDRLAIGCDGCGALTARLTHIDRQAEYTPPVIYSNEARNKLVYRAEARLTEADTIRLHPGQPVDIRLP